MANIKYRLRRRNHFVEQVDIIDITKDENIFKLSPKNIETINLTDDYITEPISPDRFVDFREKIHSSFHKGKRQLMSLLRLGRSVNSNNSDKFSKMEIQSALLQMADANEIMISNGLIYLL